MRARVFPLSICRGTGAYLDEITVQMDKSNSVNMGVETQATSSTSPHPQEMKLLVLNPKSETKRLMESAEISSNKFR